MEATEAFRVEESAKIRDENEELKGKLRDSQASLQSLVNDHAVVNARVSVLEEKARAVEEHAAQEEFIRDATIQEEVEQAIG